MSDDAGKYMQPTIPKSLEDLIMSDTVPKNEAEWWAKREIESLRQRVKEWKNLSDELMMRLGRVEEELAALKQSQGEPVAWGLQVPGEEPYLRQIWVVKDAPFNQAKERWPEAYKDAYQVPLCLCTAPTIPEGWQIVPIEPTDKMREFICDCYCDGQIDTYKSMLAEAPKPEEQNQLRANIWELPKSEDVK